MTKINQLLQTAIGAAKAGEREKARQLLMQILEQDEENETAWLWLSGTVKTKKDRQVCLDNVLALNPNNEIAKKGLKKLGLPIPQSAPPPIEEDEAEIWDQPYYDIVLPEANDPHASKFQDVWSSSANLCAYCAQPVVRSDKRCPKCRRRMVGKEPIIPNRSKYLRIWIILRSIYHVQILFGLILIAVLLQDAWPEIKAELTSEVLKFVVPFISSVIIGVLFSIWITVGLFLRQRWAYWVTVILEIFAVLFAAFIAFVFQPQPFSLPFPDWVVWLSAVSPFIFHLLFVYLIVMAGGDFKHVKQWRVAAVDERIKDPLILHNAAKMFARSKKWATAVLYWQRAASRSPGNIAILLRLADGYAQLGFPARSRDTLQSARDKTKDPKMQATLSQKIDQIAQTIQENQAA